MPIGNKMVILYHNLYNFAVWSELSIYISPWPNIPAIWVWQYVKKKMAEHFYL